MIYVGTNYHPHDWPRERWSQDIALMKDAGFTVARLGHLCWDTYEPAEGVFTLDWFDDVMALMADAGIGVILDLAIRPAPIWLHRRCPEINYTDPNGIMHPPHSRYMVDIGHPVYQDAACRYIETLCARYAAHPALLALGIDNELGGGYRSYSQAARQRFIAWLRQKYGTIAALNDAWATRRWSRRLADFDDVVLPASQVSGVQPEPQLDMHRFYSDEIIAWLRRIKTVTDAAAPSVPTVSNYWPDADGYGFDYMRHQTDVIDRTGRGFYPMLRPTDRNSLPMRCYELAMHAGESGKAPWCVEFHTGWVGEYAPPPGVLRMYAYAAMLHRAEMICAWTWRTLLCGEEQYLYGLVDHDGTPSAKYDEFAGLTRETTALAAEGILPYQPNPQVGLAISYENDHVMRGATHFYDQPYKDHLFQTFLPLYEANIDVNVVDLRVSALQYPLLVIPGHCLMDDDAAAAIRRYVAAGGTAVMTAMSAKVNASNQAFDTPLPGGLADVFGIRANRFARASILAGSLAPDGTPWQRPRVRYMHEEFAFTNDLFELPELRGADALATYVGLEAETPAITRHHYGTGQAIYVAVSSADVLRPLLRDLCRDLGIATGPTTPPDVIGRYCDATRLLYVNTHWEPRDITLPASGTGRWIATTPGRQFTLPGFGVELVTLTTEGNA